MNQDKGMKTWNFIFIILYLILVVIVGILMNRNNLYPLGIFEFTLISLATFRLIRLITYDKVMAFLREYFEMRKDPFSRTVTSLLECPWCFGTWAALMVMILYALIPFGNFLVLLLAIAGVASIIQISANLIGWKAQREKIETQRIEKK